MRWFKKRKLLFLPLPVWVVIVALLVIIGGIASARIIDQVTSETEVVEPLSVTDKVDFSSPIWPCTSVYLTFNVVNDAPVTYGLRLTPGDVTFPEGVHFGDVTVSGEPYTWGETVDIPPYGTVECSIEVVAECDADLGTVQVTINVERVAPGEPALPVIGYSPSSFSFTAVEGGDNPSDQTLSIWNAGGGTLNWSVSDDAAWLSLSPTGGTDAGTVTLSVDINGMSIGEYDADITITAPGATNTPQTVPVSLSITAAEVPTIGYSPTSFSFEAEEGGADPASETLGIWNAGTGTLDWTLGKDVVWLSLSPTSGSSTGETDDVTVSVNINGMSAGEYDGTITITAPGASNTPQTVPVHLSITAAEVPTIDYSPSSFSFEAEEGGADPASETLGIWNAGTGTLTWSVSDDAAWLSLSPTSGSSTGETDNVTVSVDINGMSAGGYDADITITAPGATNSPVTVPVSLTISEPLPEWWEISYDAEGEMYLWTSMSGAAPEEPEPSPAICGFDTLVSTATYAGSTYREIVIPSDSWWWTPVCSDEPIPMLNYVTIEVVWQDGAGDGDGELYVTEDGIDVDISGETTETGTVLTWGNASDDPAGSAWVHLPLQANTYSSPTLPDPENPATWGSLILPVPMDMYYTTAVSTNHVTDAWEASTPGYALNCSTVTGGPGAPFAEAGGPAPYVGTSGTIVATGGLLDMTVLGFIELDVQYMMELTLTPGP